MGTVRRTRSSFNDMVDVWTHVADRASPQVADRLVAVIDDNIRILADFPKAGTACPEIRPRVRRFPVGGYVIYYRPIRSGIEVLRVLHGARDVRRQFRKRP